MTSYYHRSEFFSLFTSNIPLIKTFSIILLIAGALFLGSCEEDPTFIGKDILPSSDFVKVTSVDTFSINSYTNYDYPIRTEGQSAPYLGTSYDPYFGTITSEFISQVRMEREWIKGDYRVDSVKLVLRILSVAGSTTSVKQLRITEVGNKLYGDSAYYSNTPVDTTDFGFTVDLPVLRTDTINVVEINLPPSFGEYLIRDQEQLFYSTSTEDFRDYFKGVYIRVLSTSYSDPLIIGLNVTQAPSLGDYSDYFKVYMRGQDDNNEYFSFRFLLDPSKENARYSRVKHDFSTANPDKVFSDVINKPVLDTLSYIQGLNGVYTKLIIPGLEALKNDTTNGKTAVNKASLFVPVQYDGEYYTSATLPDNIYLRYYNKAGSKVLIPDYYIDDYHEYFGGKLDTTNSRYKFNISSFVQDYINDKEGLLKPELEIFQSATEIKNAILKANASKSPVKLEMTITNF
ncbi:MAG TPA: DUF4270 family protein [Bacteroidales bacterium]|nr:DUF4270 family protein [Bacteroidales bacterium]